MSYRNSNDYNWLNDCLIGKYKGLEKAAQIYTASIKQPMYFRLVVLELMENLTSGNEEIRRNSLWMLSKIVEEQHEYQFMSPTIQILVHSLQEKNQAICYYALKSVNEIVSTYLDQFKDVLPKLVENLNRPSLKIKLITASIITQFRETDPNAMQSAIKLLVQALKEKELGNREMAIKALLRIDKHIDQVVRSIMEAFDDERFRARMTKHIFRFIKWEPVKVIEGLRQTIKNKDEKVRTNSIIFMHQISLTKHASELLTAIPELLEAMSDKTKIIHRTAIIILYTLSKYHAESLREGLPKFIRFLKIKNKQLLTYIVYIIVQLLKYYPEELSDQIDPLIKRIEKNLTWEDITPEIEIINTISLCYLLRYKNELASALNLAQNCVKGYELEQAVYELHFFIGYTHYFLGNFSDSIQAFLRAEAARKKGDYYTATIANCLIAFNFALLRLFKSCLDYKRDAEKYFEVAKKHVSLWQSQKLEYLIQFVNAIANQYFDKAETALRSYHALEPVKHPFDQYFHQLDFKNLRKVKKFYIESQEILRELKKDEPGEEPPVLE